MAKKTKTKQLPVLDMTGLIINSAGKFGRHDDEVKTGCGPHKSLKDYTRKKKHKKQVED